MTASRTCSPAARAADQVRQVVQARLRPAVQLLMLVPPERAHDPVQLDQALPRDVLDAADRPHRNAGIPLAGQPGRARLHCDGAELVRDDVVQFACEAGPLLVVRQPGRGGGRVPVGRGHLTQAERRRQERQRQGLRQEAVGVSLMFEPLVLAIHIAVGLAFVVLASMHLAQRRRVSARLLTRLARVRMLAGPAGRLALADLLLAAVTAGMLVSGFWDWLAGHPTKIRWHAITGVVLAILLLAHTVRRRTRLRRSTVR